MPTARIGRSSLRSTIQSSALRIAASVHTEDTCHLSVYEHKRTIRQSLQITFTVFRLFQQPLQKYLSFGADYTSAEASRRHQTGDEAAIADQDHADIGNL